MIRRDLLKKASIGLAASAAVIFALFFFGANFLVRAAVKKYAPRVTGTEVEIGGVWIEPLRGRGRITGLAVGNPAGYRTRNAIRFRNFTVDLAMNSLVSGKLRIERLLVEGAEITYETGGPGGSNLRQLQRNVEARSTPSHPGGKAGARRVQIDLLEIRNGRIRLATALTAGGPLEAALPDITLEGIGAGPAGVGPEEAASMILGRMVGAAVRAAAAGAAKRARHLGESVGKEIGKGVKGVFGE